MKKFLVGISMVLLCAMSISASVESQKQTNSNPDYSDMFKNKYHITRLITKATKGYKDKVIRKIEDVSLAGLCEYDYYYVELNSNSMRRREYNHSVGLMYHTGIVKIEEFKKEIAEILATEEERKNNSLKKEFRILVSNLCNGIERELATLTIAKNVIRKLYLIDIANKRGVPVEELMDENDLPKLGVPTENITAEERNILMLLPIKTIYRYRALETRLIREFLQNPETLASHIRKSGVKKGKKEFKEWWSTLMRRSMIGMKNVSVFMREASKLLGDTYSDDDLVERKIVEDGTALILSELDVEYKNYTDLSYARSVELLELYENNMERFCEYVKKLLDRAHHNTGRYLGVYNFLSRMLQETVELLKRAVELYEYIRDTTGIRTVDPERIRNLKKVIEVKQQVENPILESIPEPEEKKEKKKSKKKEKD